MPPSPNYLILASSSHERPWLGTPRTARNVSYISITLARSLHAHFSKVRLVISDEGPFMPGGSLAIIRQRVHPSLSSKHKDDLAATYSPRDSESVCTINLTFKEDIPDYWDPRVAPSDRMYGGFLKERPRPTLRKAEAKPLETIIFDMTFEYSKERPIFLALESTHRLWDAHASGDRLWGYFNFHFHIAPATTPLLSFVESSVQDQVVSIATLPPELIFSIVRHLLPEGCSHWDSSYASRTQLFLTLALVNRSFSSIFLPALYSSVGHGHPDVPSRVTQIGLSTASFAAGLDQQPDIRRYVTGFADNEFARKQDFRAYTQIFTLATEITHMTIGWHLFRRLLEPASGLRKIETFQLTIDAYSYEDHQTHSDLYEVFRHWPRLKTLFVHQTGKPRAKPLKNYQEPKMGQEPPFSLTEICLHRGRLWRNHILSLIPSSGSSLQVFSLYDIRELTPQDLSNILTIIRPNLAKLEVVCYEFSCQGDSELGSVIESMLPSMPKLKELIVTDDIITPACISQTRSRPPDPPYPRCTITIAIRRRSKTWSYEALKAAFTTEEEQLVRSGELYDFIKRWERVILHSSPYIGSFREEMVNELTELAAKRGVKVVIDPYSGFNPLPRFLRHLME